MSSICINDLTIKFRSYHDNSPSLKSWFANLLNKHNAPEGYSDHNAVDSVSLKVGEGERVGIIGANGAGKSTLLKAICGIYPPASGSVSVVGRIAPLLEIGAGFHPEFTGRENIYFNGVILGYSDDMLVNMEHEIIEFAGVEEFIDMPVKYYSTGMYMRLAFSVATAVHPDILILDEVFAGGDAGFINKAVTRLESVIDKASIMMLVSHDLDLMRRYCDRIIWIDRGAIRLDGATKDVIKHYVGQFT